MELKEVHSDLYSLAKLYGLLHEDFPQAVSSRLDERTRFLLKKLLDDAVDKRLAVHSKIIVAAKSGVLNAPKSSSSTILNTVKDNLQPSDSASGESKRLSKEEEQSIVKPVAIQEAGPEFLRVDSISSKADDGTKRCKICQRSKSMNQVVNSKDDHVNCNELQGPSEKDRKALIPAITGEKLQRKPSISRSVVSVLTSPGTEMEANNGKLEEILSDFMENLLKTLKEKKPSRSSNHTGNHKESNGNSEREIQHKPGFSVSASPGTETADNNRRPEKIARDFSKKLLNAIKEPEPSSLSNNKRNHKGSPCKYERDVSENMNKNLKVKDIVQRTEANNGGVKGSESRITPTGRSNDLRAKKTLTQSRSYSHKRHVGHQTLMKPTPLNYYNADTDKENDHDDNDDGEDHDDDDSSWSDKKNHIERSMSLEELEEELTPLDSQSDPGSSFVSSTRKLRIGTSSRSLPRSFSSSVSETNTDDSCVRSKTAASSVMSGTYSDRDTYSSQRNHRTPGLSKLRRLKNKLGLIFHHHHHHHLKNNHRRSKWRNVNRMVLRKTNHHKYEKRAVEELGKTVANNPKYEKKAVEEWGKKAAAVEESGKAAAASKKKKKKQNHEVLFDKKQNHEAHEALFDKKQNHEALFDGFTKGLMSHVQHTKDDKNNVATTDISPGKQENWWGVLKNHPGLAKLPKQRGVKIASRNTKPKLKLKRNTKRNTKLSS